MKIGDRVVLKNIKGIYKAEHDKNNPKKTEGTVESIHDQTLPIWVRWDNGIRNSYDDKNLVKI